MARRTLAIMTIGAFALAFTAATAADDKKKDEKTPSIKEIMKKGHQGKSLLKAVGGHAKEMKWDEAKTEAESLKKFGEALGKNDPPKGEKDSWKKLTDEYKDNTKAVYDGAEKKDAKATAEALGKIGKSCKACHDGHK